MIDGNILAVLIGIAYAILTHKLMIEQYHKLFIKIKQKINKETFVIKKIGKKKTKELTQLSFF